MYIGDKEVMSYGGASLFMACQIVVINTYIIYNAKNIIWTGKILNFLIGYLNHGDEWIKWVIRKIKEILDDLEYLIDSGKAKAWEIARYLKLKRKEI